MQYSPKLKKAAAEIQEILNKHDIAAHVVLHTPGFAEYILHITPSYSAAWLENETLRFRARAEDYNGNKMIRDQKIADTVDMFRAMADVGGRNVLQLLHAADTFDKITGAEHEEGGHTSHSTQNN